MAIKDYFLYFPCLTLVLTFALVITITQITEAKDLQTCQPRASLLNTQKIKQ